MDHKSVLIIKHGFSETCDKAISKVVSYGDVFRCTCLLEVYKGWHVTWITAHKAHDLLAGNHLIDELILADDPSEVPQDLILDHYTAVINLEKQPDWCSFAGRQSAQTHYGFKNWLADDEDSYYPASAKALSTALDQSHYRPLQETLFQTVGLEWTGQRYVLGHQPRIPEIYDIGLNYHIGPKWPTKAWPQENWQNLHDRLEDKYAICWQQSLDSVRNYIDWLASCRMIITTDSLGLHLALALNKKIVALFGPTSDEQVYMYGCGVKLTPACDRDCMPCFDPTCRFEDCCMTHISVDRAVEAVEHLFHNEPLAPLPATVATEADKALLNING